MSTYTTTTVKCDGCGGEAKTWEKTPAKARKKVANIHVGTYYPWAYIDGQDLCGECLAKLNKETKP